MFDEDEGSFPFCGVFLICQPLGYSPQCFHTLPSHIRALGIRSKVLYETEKLLRSKLSNLCVLNGHFSTPHMLAQSMPCSPHITVNDAYFISSVFLLLPIYHQIPPYTSHLSLEVTSNRKSSVTSYVCPKCSVPHGLLYYPILISKYAENHTVQNRITTCILTFFPMLCIFKRKGLSSQLCIPST